jgi:hypothetical protein
MVLLSADNIHRREKANDDCHPPLYVLNNYFHSLRWVAMLPLTFATATLFGSGPRRMKSPVTVKLSL